MGFPDGLVVKNPPANAEARRSRYDPWVKKISWRRKWQPTPVFWTGQFQTEGPDRLQSRGVTKSQTQLSN